MIAYAKRLTNSKFVRNVAIVATGTAGAQAITMAFSPIITRLYGPEAFGVLGTFMAILTVLTPLAALSYPIAMVLPKRDADAIGLAKLSIGIAVLMSLLTAVLLLLFKAPLVEIFNLESIEPFIQLLPVAMLFSAAMAVMSQWVIRKKLFKIKAKVAVLQALWLNSAKAGIGLFSPFPAVLVVLAAAGSAIHAIMLYLGIKGNNKGHEKNTDVSNHKEGADGEHSGLREISCKYSRFAIYRTPQEFISSATQSLPVVMLAAFFGPASAGFYALGRMVLMMPTNLVGSSVRDVIYPRMAETANLGKSITGILLKSTLALILIGIAPYGFVIAFGPWLFGLVFGDEWVLAGEYARWLSLMLLFNFSNKPCVSAIPVLGLERLFLIYGIFSGAMRVLGVGIGYWVWESDIAAIIAFSLLGMTAYMVLLFIVIKSSVDRDKLI